MCRLRDVWGIPAEAGERDVNSWFSQQSIDAGCGSFFYLRADGTEVEVTAVNTSAESYDWPDKEDRGDVVAYLRPGQPAERADTYYLNSIRYHGGLSEIKWAAYPVGGSPRPR